jgi:WD40 repeat protein
MAVSPNGRMLVTTTGVGPVLWDATTGHELTLPLGFKGYAANSVAFNPDSTSLVTTSPASQTVKWALPGTASFTGAAAESSTAEESARLPEGLGFSGTTVTWSQVGDYFAVARTDGMVLVIAGQEGHPHDKLLTWMTYWYTQAAVSADGSYLMPIGRHSQSTLTHPRVYHVASGDPAGPELPVGKHLTGGAFAPDGKEVVTLNAGAEILRSAGELPPARNPGQVRFWDWRQGKEAHTPVATPSEPQDAAFSPDGRLLVVVCAGGQILLIDPASGLQEGALEHGSAQEGRRICPDGNVRFSPEGESFVTFGIGTKAQVWDRASGKTRTPPLEHPGGCWTASYSHDGQFLVTGGADKKAIVWDAHSGRPLATMLEHPDGVVSAAFSPAGDQVLTASTDARVWDWRREALACPPLSHQGTLASARFSTDGRWILTAGQDAAARLWDPVSGMPLGPRRSLASQGLQVLFTPGDARAVVAGDVNRLSIFDLSDLHPAAVDELGIGPLIAGAEVMAGQRVHGTGIANLTSEDWLGRWQSLRQQSPGWPAYDIAPGPLREWHLRRADALEVEGNFEGARWHLERASALGAIVESSRLLDFEQFVRTWRIPAVTRPFMNHREFVFRSDDQRQVKALQEDFSSARIAHSPGPYIDFIRQSPFETTYRAAYAFRTVISDTPRKIRILTGSDDAFRVWVNARPVIERLVFRGAIPDQDSATVELLPGVNTILVEISNGGGGWGFYFRIEDESGQKLRLTDDGRLKPLHAPRR